MESLKATQPSLWRAASGDTRYEGLARRLEGAGLSEDGARWVLRALHPATVVGGPIRGPTGGTVPTVVAEFVEAINIASPGSVDDGPWDALVCTSNSDVVAGFVATRITGNSWVFTNIYQATPGQSTNSTSVSSVVANQTTTSGTGVVILPSSNTTFTSAPFLAGQVIAGYQTWVPATGYPVSWRRLSSSVTVDNTSTALYDGGSVTAGCFDAVREPTAASFCVGVQSSDVATPGDNVITIGNALTAPQLAPFVRYVSTRIPVEVADMLQANKGCSVGAAKAGVYLPTRLSGLDWQRSAQIQTAANTVFVSGGGIVAPWAAAGAVVEKICTPTWVDGLVMYEQTFTPMDGPSSPGNAGNWPMAAQAASLALAGGASSWPLWYGTGVDQSKTSLAFFGGLPPQATLFVKFCTVLEIETAPQSAGTAFTQLPPAPDERALDLYFRILHVLPQAEPASANSLGAILTAVGAALKWVLPSLFAFGAPIAMGLGNRIGGSNASVMAPPGPAYAPERMPLREVVERPKAKKKKAKMVLPVSGLKKSLVGSLPRRK